MTGKFVSSVLVVFASMAIAPPVPAQRSDAAPVDRDRTASTCDESGTLVEFRASSTRLSPEAKAALAGMAVWAKDSRARSIRLRGMTDGSGSARANATLSRQRAEAVRAYLLRLGVDPMRVSAMGHDDEVAKDGDENRRAVSVVTCVAAPMALATDPPPLLLRMGTPSPFTSELPRLQVASPLASPPPQDKGGPK
jgi:peptidoglycan-associated lipoprotein